VADLFCGAGGTTTGAMQANLWCLIKDGLICICVMDEEIVIRAATAVERDQMLSAGRESRR
jgi:site-specific DNA-cytosine methylase